MCGFGIGIRIYEVDHTYIRLIVRLQNIFDFLNRSFQLSKGLSSLFLIMEDSVFLIACSHNYCVMVTYLRVKSAFILVGTYVHAIIITYDPFKSIN